MKSFCSAHSSVSSPCLGLQILLQASNSLFLEVFFALSNSLPKALSLDDKLIPLISDLREITFKTTPLGSRFLKLLKLFSDKRFYGFKIGTSHNPIMRNQ
jgi:hypothetical protein